MSDSYATFWSYLWWGLGGIALVLTLLDRGATLGGSVVVAFIAAVLIGVGFWAQGSRSQDALRQSNEDLRRAQQDLIDANMNLCGRPRCPGGAF